MSARTPVPPLPPLSPPPPYARPGPRPRNVLLAILAALVLALALIVAGAMVFGVTILRTIHVRARTGSAGKTVEITSPFGSLHVNQSVSPADFGIDIYPGARMVGQNEASAFSRNLDIDGQHIPRVHVHIEVAGKDVLVNVAEFETPAPTSTLLSFYRSRLSKYGHVVEEEKDDNGVTLHVKEGSDNHSNDNERAVVVKPWEGKTRFLLVRVTATSGGI